MELLFRYELQKLQTMNIKITEQSGIYTLISEQIISASLQEVWEFFTHPKNLDSITPSEYPPYELHSVDSCRVL